jgi:mono/diheme cytochrome c family protein
LPHRFQRRRCTIALNFPHPASVSAVLKELPMAKTGFFASILALAAVFTITALLPSEVDAGEKCRRTEFKTVAVKEACAKDQKAAKDQMKKFMKAAKFKNCQVCHSSLAPEYKLKPDGLKKYLDAGGK